MIRSWRPVMITTHWKTHRQDTGYTTSTGTRTGTGSNVLQKQMSSTINQPPSTLILLLLSIHLFFVFQLITIVSFTSSSSSSVSVGTNINFVRAFQLSSSSSFILRKGPNLDTSHTKRIRLLRAVPTSIMESTTDTTTGSTTSTYRNTTLSMELSSSLPMGTSLLSVKPDQLKNRNTITAIIIDVENVRGFNGFIYTHTQLLHLLQLYIQNQPSQPSSFSTSSLLLVIDHGNVPSSYYVPLRPNNDSRIISDSDGYAVIFAGPHCKADDTIVHDVLPYLLASLVGSDRDNAEPPSIFQKRIQVITADRMLISRCHRAVREYYKSRDTIQPTNGNNNSNRNGNKKIKKGYTMEISNVNSSSNIRLEVVSPKVLLTDLVRLNASLKVTDDSEIDINGGNVDAAVSLNQFKNNVSARSRKLRSSRTFIKKETTEDRIILAEALRLELEQQQHPQLNNIEHSTTCSISPAQAYVIHKHRNSHSSMNRATTNSLQQITAATSTNHGGTINLANDGEISSALKDLSPTFASLPETLRLVVVSDTHGFEDQLTSPLPDGDVLLHLGDFAMDTVVMNTAGGNKSRRSRHDNSQLKNFDAWLAKQSAPMKIVVRGNHDPRSMAFVKSGAIYLTQPTVMDIGGYKFAFVPFQSATKNGLRHKGTIPKTGCDVIVSHVPPYSLLDRCHTGKLAGSNTLLKGAQSINGKDGPPVLWLCGHIHESRGIVRDVVLCKNKSKDVVTSTTSTIGTTVINAACANLGRANYIEYGATVLDLCNKKLEAVNLDVGTDGTHVNNSNNSKMNKKVNLVHMDGRYEFMNSKYPYFFRNDGINDATIPSHCTSINMLLAIDLGLRTGISLFDRSNNGQLVRYEHFDYDTVAALESGASQLLQEWESDLNAQRNRTYSSNNNTTIVYRITHIAIEGSDPPLIEAWKRVIQQRKDNSSHHMNMNQQPNSVLGLQTKLLLVSPNEWRTDLLTRTERETGESAKAASRRMAQDIIHEHNVHHIANDAALSTTELPKLLDVSTDVAESIMLGYHIIRRLGWCNLYNDGIKQKCLCLTDFKHAVSPWSNTICLLTINWINVC